MLKATVFATGFAVLMSILTSCVESSEIRFISPIGAAARSVIPGWGQIYTRNKLGGVVIFVSVGILAGSGVLADAEYRHYYYDKYTPAVVDPDLVDPNLAADFYDRSNQYYKLSRFLLYTAAGIWVYSIIDAYVDAHIYNARQQMRMLDIDDGRLRQLKLGAGLTLDAPSRFTGCGDYGFFLVLGEPRSSIGNRGD